jgi:predicted dehydrogenase
MTGAAPGAVGIGVLGSGFMGRTWAEVADRHLPGARLVGVAGGRRAPGLAADHGCALYDDLAGMLSDPGVAVVVLATPPAGHGEQAAAAAAAGKHLLIEKPMANSVSECRRIAAACARAQVACAVVSQHRFRGAPRAARAVVDAGGIGRVTMVRAIGPEVGFWDTEKTMDQWKLDPLQQSAFASWGAHACDLVRWFVGDEPDLAFAVFGSYTDAPPPGRSAMATYRFRDGAMAQLWMSYDIPPPGLGSGLQLQLVGTLGMIELDSYGTVRVADADGWRTEFQQPPFDAGNPSDPVRLTAYRDQLADLLDAAASGRAPLVDADQGAATTGMLEAAERSARDGVAVSLPQPG